VFGARWATYDTSVQYTREQRHELEAALRAGSELKCPACGGRISTQAVPAPPAVAYVRDRIWIVCLDCKRSVSVDRRSV
jgi:hypothetical protein